MNYEGQEWFRVFGAMVAFAVVGFLVVAAGAGPKWGVVAGAFGFISYITGYCVGLVFGREQR
jgi:hypothetical protein